jgi:putative transposase
VSNDNPFSEAAFKTVKYQPDYPGRFSGAPHARSWMGDFFGWYAYRHRHSGLAMFTPADVFLGRVSELAEQRQRALDAAYAAHPERFVRGRPSVRLPPAKVTINPIDPGAPLQTAKDVLAGIAAAPRPHPFTTPAVVLPGAPRAATVMTQQAP